MVWPLDLTLSAINEFFIYFQFECCGNKKYSDWFNVTWDKASTDNVTTVPKSCCKDMELTDCNNPKNVHNHAAVGKYIYTEVGTCLHIPNSMVILHLHVD